MTTRRSDREATRTEATVARSRASMATHASPGGTADDANGPGSATARRSQPRCAWRSWWGLLRSAVIYRRPGRQRALRRLYADFVRPGDLAFDIGAHLGDRSIAMAALGARVVAFEPQPLLRHFLAFGSGRRDAIDVRGEGLGREHAKLRLAVSATNPTVASLSAFWPDGLARANPGFASVRWDQHVDVTVTTLDAMIAEYGVPAFCKIDVEGFEAEVLGGLSQPLPALSLEFVRGAESIALQCLDRLQDLGEYRFNVIAGEGRRFHFVDWVDANTLRRFVQALPDGWSSGDVYARLATADAGAPVQSGMPFSR